MTSVWWARRDLRLADNPALLEAQANDPAAGVFAWTPPLHFWSGRRQAHLAKSLYVLREATGGALGVRRGEAAAIVAAVAREHDAAVVYASQEFSPSGIREQEAVSAALTTDGRELRFVSSPYAVAPGQIVKANGTEYRVYTPFLRAWREHGWRPPAPAADPERLVLVASDVDLDQQAAHGDTSDPLGYPHEFGEAAAHERLKRFIARPVADYADDRDRPDRDGTSGLSVALAFGEIHPRTVLAATHAAGGPGADKFEAELAWREFHADTLFHHPRALRESLTPVLPDDSWAEGPEATAHLLAWQQGRTGFPLVDAGMRELEATGTMHNRVRMVVASFLIKDLHIPWQRGADHFRRRLLDYDHAQNQLNWQWAAGTGRDAAPFFRVFNPDVQAAKFDPERHYVWRWVPEVDTPNYPEPIVDHAIERRITLESYRRRPR